MKKNVVAYRKLPADLTEDLKSRYNVTAFDRITDENRAAFLTAFAEAHGSIGATEKLTPEMIESAKNLEIIATISVGYDAYDVPALTGRDIMIANTPGVLTETTADMVFTLVLATARRVVEVAEYVKSGKWTANLGEDMFGIDVSGKTIGVFGMGRIGTAVARRAVAGFGMKLIYNDFSRSDIAEKEYGAQFVDKDELLRTADFVCITLPLSDQTRHMISTGEFDLMKPSAILINGARGPIVDEEALIEALRAKKIRAAGLDVFSQEPLPVTSPLLSFPNVTALPHIGSATLETRRKMAERAVENLIAGLDGKKPPYLINTEVWDRKQQGK